MNEEIKKDHTAINDEVIASSKKSKNKLAVTISVIALVIIGLFAFTKLQREKVELKPYTLSDISQHNNRDDCWTTIDGGVYNVTKFVSRHKGGDKILNACGVDATALFTGVSPMGRVHSAMAHKILSSMKIGTLSN